MVINRNNAENQEKDNNSMREQSKGKQFRQYVNIGEYSCVLIAGVAVPYVSFDFRNLEVPADLPSYLSDFLESNQESRVPFTHKGSTSVVRLLKTGVSSKSVSYEVNYER